MNGHAKWMALGAYLEHTSGQTGWMGVSDWGL